MHSADGWRALLEPVVARYRGIVKRLYFRGDTAFANPEIYELLEKMDYRWVLAHSVKSASVTPLSAFQVSFVLPSMT